MRRRSSCLAALTLAGSIGALAGTGASARNIALVIGNDAYANVTPLQKAVNDAHAIGDVLERLGFVVRRVDNVDQRGMSRALVDFDTDVQPGDRALFFYAGHGFEIGGTNYLLPTDVPAARSDQEDLIRDAAFPVQRIIDGIRQRGAGVSILVLDACRDNPFAGDTTRSTAVARGLARVDAPEGVFVLMSAGAKQEALDRLSDQDTNPNSVFTRSFLGELAKPGRTLVEIAKKTQVDVRALAATVGYDQTPAYYDQVIGDVVLTDGSNGGQAGGQQVAAAETGHVYSSVPTQINTTGTTQAGVGVTIGAGVKIGPGVIIGGKDAKIALKNPANPPTVDPAKALNIQQGSAGGQQLALVRPDANLGQPGQGSGRAPIASFMRSTAGWTVTLSLPEPATNIAYRVGSSGAFRETGLLNVLDQRTGNRMPNPSFQMSPRAGAGVIEVRYRTIDGVDVGPYPIRFDPEVALYDDQRRNLEQIAPSWVEFRDFNGTLIYFTTLVTYRCAISDLRYGLDGGEPLRRFDLPACNMKDPFSVPDNARIYIKVPTRTKAISLRITWRDGTQSDVNTIERD